jgi:hypothetical protein
MKRPTYEDFKKEVLKDPEFKKAYDALEDEYKIKRELIRMRKKLGLTKVHIVKLSSDDMKNVKICEKDDKKLFR